MEKRMWEMLKKQNLSDAANKQLGQKGRLWGQLWTCWYTKGTWSCSRCRRHKGMLDKTFPLKDLTAYVASRKASTFTCKMVGTSSMSCASAPTALCGHRPYHQDLGLGGQDHCRRTEARSYQCSCKAEPPQCTSLALPVDGQNVCWLHGQPGASVTGGHQYLLEIYDRALKIKKTCFFN